MTDEKIEPTISQPLSQSRLSLLQGAALLLCLVLLLLHVDHFWFLCDDALISFRYARNLAEGHGLVFNPGFERVEGYTNFLWVLLLAAGTKAGFTPQHLANPLSVICTGLLFVIVLRFCWRNSASAVSGWWLIFPALFLATNRSFAVWATSGLETRLFELLIVLGVLRSLEEIRLARLGAATFPWSSLLLALATLTRPDGLLIAVCVIGARFALLRQEQRLGVRTLLFATLTYLLPVISHFIFRRFYYADWLPNTYYAKVDGQTWWATGAQYLTAFALEYGVILWAPLFFMSYQALRRLGRVEIFWLIVAAIVPHAIYIAGIGGDHFEYRPLDLYIPLMAVLLYFGASTAIRRARQAALVAYSLLILLAGAALPAMAHRSFPADYRSGFPGITSREDQSSDLIAAREFPRLSNAPLLGDYLAAYNSIYRDLTRQFVAVRQEEHAAFFHTVEKQGRWLAELVADGRLPRDTCIATSCVGAIPFFSGLRTLDRHGLTDRFVAHQPADVRPERLMAHQKTATIEYARSRGVDFWAMDNVHLILPSGHPMLAFYGYLSGRGRADVLAADLGDSRFLLISAPQGDQSALQRFASLNLRPAHDVLAAELQGDFQPIPRQAQFDLPYDTIYAKLADSLLEAGEIQAARGFFERALATNPINSRARIGLNYVNNRWPVRH